MKKRVLIISREQFGYNTDRYKWCEYLRDKYDITYFSIASRDKYYLSGVKLRYLYGKLPRLIRGFLFWFIVIIRVFLFRGIVIINYFPGCELLQRLFPKKKIICDFRTMSVFEDKKRREKDNNLRRRAAKTINHITAISEGVAEQLKVNDKKVVILPLGAEAIETGDKKFDNIHLLYIGTLYNRNIEATIRGFSMVIDKLPQSFELSYDIVGDGPKGEKKELEQLVSEYGLENRIKLHGYVQHDKLFSFFNNCNVGVSFVPQTTYYDYQPVTKTFEYALAGLFVIATDTFSNREVINSDNGIVIQDNAQSFCDGLLKLYEMRDIMNSSLIKESLLRYSWPNIIDEVLSPLIESLFNPY